MHPRALSSFGVAAALLFATSAMAFDSSAKPASTSNESTVAPAKPMLEKGMTTEQVERIASKPGEITPRNSPEGKAETWIYQRVIERQTRQVAATVAAVSTFKGATFGMDSPLNGPAVGQGISAVPEYHLAHTTVYQVTALLMFEGKLVVAKQWREKSETFDN